MKAVDAYDVILSPIITEKSTMASEHSQVVFRVARTASKPDVKAAVEQLFGGRGFNGNRRGVRREYNSQGCRGAELFQHLLHLLRVACTLT